MDRQLVAMIGTEGKSREQIKREAMEALAKFTEATADVLGTDTPDPA
jgi:hypothetical protein